MTPPLDDVRAALEKMTPGEWFLTGPLTDEESGIAGGVPAFIVADCADDSPAQIDSEQDLEAICTLRNAAPALLAQIDALKAENERMAKERDAIREKVSQFASRPCPECSHDEGESSYGQGFCAVLGCTCQNERHRPALTTWDQNERLRGAVRAETVAAIAKATCHLCRDSAPVAPAPGSTTWFHDGRTQDDQRERWFICGASVVHQWNAATIRALAERKEPT